MAQSNNDHKGNARQELNQPPAGQHESKGHQSKTQKEKGTRPSQASGSQNEHAIGKNAKAPASQAKPSTTGQATHDESSAPSKSTKANESSGKAASKDQNISGNGSKSTSSKQAQPNNKAAQAPNAGTTGKQTQDENSASHNGRQNAASPQNPGTASNSVQPSNGSGNKVQVQGANLSTEQQTKVSEVSRSIISRNDAPRIGNPDFSISVGTVIPTHVHYVRVPETLVTVYPQWRNDDYFVVRDEIVIVDHSRRIVAVVPAGSERANTERTTVVDLSPAETREVQTVLIERGYLHGQADGEWGPRTRDALISFQRKEGAKATGRVDQRTVQSLGLSGKIKTGSIGNGNENARSQSQNAANGHEPSGSQATRSARPAPQNTSSAKANMTTSLGKPRKASASKSSKPNSTTDQSLANGAPANATEHKGSRQQTTGRGISNKEKRKHRDETTGAK
jgi:hypothetical protein